MVKAKVSRIPKTILISFAIILSLSFFGFVIQQQTDPWTPDQLLEPADLASTLNNSESPQPFIISIGPGAVIKNSQEVGPTGEKPNLMKLQSQLDTLSRDASIVIYCGCCPFNKCPNIRPAFSLMNTMGFKNHKLLNLTRNVKADWIDRGYPVRE